jgi:hypothetical protein
MYSVWQGNAFSHMVVNEAESKADALKKLAEWFVSNDYEVIETTEEHVLVRFMGSVLRYTVHIITSVI